MKLTNFSVTNFRSITAAHKLAISDAAVLIGKNNEGKSNLLTALQVAMELLQLHALDRRRGARGPIRRSQELYSWSRDFPVQFQNRSRATDTIFRMEFTLDSEEISDFKSEIGSRLNGTLPLEIKIGKENEATINFKKTGKNTKSLSSKSRAISDFVARRIRFNYIPAVRTDREVMGVVRNMLSRELRILEDNEEYKSALAAIQDLQKPILEDLADRIKTPLTEFLPTIKGVQIEIPETSRRYGVRSEFNVIIDDGTPTNIEYKGDGVKSLAALALLNRRVSRSGASIIAIEEPESHLHPGAIHQLNEIIESLKGFNQVILTTHSPLFVDRSEVKSNIIVESGKARPAGSISVIRDALGIKASDNLTNASYALLVEGEADLKSLRAIIPVLSKNLGAALKKNSLAIHPLRGASHLTFHVSHLKNSLCSVHVLLDHDQAGLQAFEKAFSGALIKHSEITMIKCPGMLYSEFEDMIKVDCYKSAVLEEFGVDLGLKQFKSKKKWGDRLKEVFELHGKVFNERVLSKVKTIVADAVEQDPKSCLIPQKSSSINTLIDSLERMVRV